MFKRIGKIQCHTAKSCARIKLGVTPMSRKRVKDMQKKDEYCITAGEFAKMCQTTRDTLRYYERQGILVPKKNPVNGYHYYSYAQISSYYFIRTFRELDCSVGDIKEYLLGGEEVRFDAFVDQQYDRLLMMRRELDRKIHTIAGTRKILDQIRIADAGHPIFRIQKHPLYLRLTKVESSPATSSGEIEKDIRRHLKRCKNSYVQAFPMGASIGKEQFMRGDYSYKNVFSFAEIKNSEQRNNKIEKYETADQEQEFLTEIKPGKYLVVISRESDGDISKIYEKMKELLKKEKQKLCSDIYILSIVNVIDPNEERKYLKYIFALTIDL